MGKDWEVGGNACEVVVEVDEIQAWSAKRVGLVS